MNEGTSRELPSDTSETTAEITYTAEGLPTHPVVIDSRTQHKPSESYQDGFHEDPNASLIDNLSERGAVHFHKIRVEKNTTQETGHEDTTMMGVILYVAEGNIHCTVEGRTYLLTSGDQLVIPPGHSYRTFTGVGGFARTMVSAIDSSERESLIGTDPLFIAGADIVPMPENDILTSEIPDGDSRGGNQSEVKAREDEIQLNKVKYNKNYKHPDDPAPEGVPTKVELHLWRGEIWTCLSGEMIVETGGVMENPKVKETDENEIRARTLHGSERVILKPGMQIYIPPGVPHMHYTGVGHATQVLFQRTPAPRVLSLSEAQGM